MVKSYLTQIASRLKKKGTSNKTSEANTLLNITYTTHPSFLQEPGS
jgi:hypothetical protein